jgi:predicted AlkP superfamily phosphohydrolase/phosphomutase
MEAARFERTVRTESSEIFNVFGGARRIGRVDIHYGRFEVHATLLLDVELTDDELQALIDQLDEELVQTHDPEREDFLVTVYKAEELGFYSDEFESEDDDEDEDEEEDR